MTSQPDAAFFILDHDSSLWSLPWVARADVTPADEGPKSERLVRLWFRRRVNLGTLSSVAPTIPDRSHDLEAYNEGHAPPTVFWQIHPRLEA